MKTIIRIEQDGWVSVEMVTADTVGRCEICGQKLTRYKGQPCCNGKDFKKHLYFAKSVKTNKNWYPDQPMGSYYKLEDGILLFSPMMEDGTRAEEDGVVDFGFLEEENEDLKNGENIVEHLNNIIKSLIIKE